MDYRDRITIEPGKRGGKPCIRGMRITVYEVLDYLASGMTQEQLLADFPYLVAEDIQACLAYAADRNDKQWAQCHFSRLPRPVEPPTSIIDLLGTALAHDRPIATRYLLLLPR
jgi:uncharacterized protein (DUF433 family)